MKTTARFLFCAGFAASTPLVHAQSAEGLSFFHRDWELACDNTRTCRAAGYQDDDDELAVSVLLTRVAGPGVAVTGEVMLGNYFEIEAVDALPAEFEISLQIDGQAVGAVPMSRDSLLADMSTAQVSALLDALTRDSTIEWVAGGTSWTLSDSGSTAVLLKMDEFQGRLDTPGALVRKGTRDESEVLPPVAVPVVSAADLADPRAGDDQFIASGAIALQNALRSTLEDPYDCPSLTEEGEPEFQARRLTDSQMLVSVPCTLGAYNETIGYWVVADEDPYEPRLITTQGSNHDDGNIHASNKGRGLGDCWSLDRWTWDGERFVHSAASTTGMCRGIAPGGAWSLPTLTMNIESPAE
ncbi:MAG: DUF1176 domain-containing protein [Gammaproteobacteria bacterium]|nr:DUF1176 domain-containing protein [Gammaproteobacteria bacterium]MDH4256369.1 DUF1176 domain-containing protein [Gammaproteobacteria bacterium]